jgi:hypothetical protein
MAPHRHSGTSGIMGLDRGQHLCVLGDHLRHASRLGQSEAAIAIDLNLHLLDKGPDPRISRDLRNGCVKCFVCLMKSLTIGDRIRLALALKNRMQVEDLAGRRALGGEPSGGFLQRFSDDDRLRERPTRNARGEDARLRKDFDQAVIGRFRMASRTGVRLTPWASAISASEIASPGRRCNDTSSERSSV